MGKKKVAVIGAGGRANAYLMYGAKETFDLVAIADPNLRNRETFLGLNDLVGLVQEYDSWETMFQKHELDGVIICTPNHSHLLPAVAAMERGIVVALEKPIAERPDACRQILESKKAFNARVLVGFVLRSAPFYRQAKLWIDEGKIGDIVTIQADEIPPVLTTSVMFRSDWRRFSRFSGGSMNEKCCHDVDLLNWLVDSQPVSLYSSGGIKSLAPRADLPERCCDCSATSQCAYYLPPEIYEHPDMVNRANDGLLYKFTRDNSACIYNNGHDLFDHQQTLISYSCGATATLTLDFSGKGKMCGRNLKVIGTKGVLFGKLEDNQITLFESATELETVVDLRIDASGHGGANRSHTDAFVRLMEDASFESEATVEAGFLSSMMCFAADESVEKRSHVDLTDIVQMASAVGM